MQNDAITSQEVTKQVKARQANFIADHYDDLTKCIKTNMRRYTGPQYKREELESDVFLRLVLKVQEKAFIDAGWQGETDCIAQSKTKVVWLVKTLLKRQIPIDEREESFDAIVESQEEGFSPPLGFIEATTSEDYNPELLLMRKQLNQAIRAFATSEYEQALIDVILGERQAKCISVQFDVNKNTVTQDKRDLLEKIRANLVMGDYV
jgi:hypothetical protein